jgi:hypothetical protein
MKMYVHSGMLWAYSYSAYVISILLYVPAICDFFKEGSVKD